MRHLRTQGLWVQEARVTGRLSYKKVLGTKNPADMLTKHMPGDLMDKHLETLGAEVQAGRAQAAPELNSAEVESLVLWLEEALSEGESHQKRVRFSTKIAYRAIPQERPPAAASARPRFRAPAGPVLS